MHQRELSHCGAARSQGHKGEGAQAPEGHSMSVRPKWDFSLPEGVNTKVALERGSLGGGTRALTWESGPEVSKPPCAELAM